MTDAAIQACLSGDPAECARLVHWFDTESDRDWTQIILSFSSLAEYQPFLGCSIAEIAEKQGVSPAECVMDVLQRDAARAQGAFGSLSVENMRRILNQDYVCCGSDENARPLSYELGRSHPRGFGSFPRFINLLCQENTLAEAIRRVTSLPARIFGLKNRGLIRSGYYADLVLFDEQEWKDNADFVHPHAPASGIRRVYVNGVESFRDGQVTARAGRFLERV
jgi:N-acyl-D-amino-acid deacylase